MRHKLADVVMRTYQSTAKFISQCQSLCKDKDTITFLYVIIITKLNNNNNDICITNNNIIDMFVKL